MKVSHLFRINFAVILISICESALSPEIRKAYSGLLSGKGLYLEEDGIVILNATNFKTIIYGTKNAWLVEFYNSWCGHCHKFAPIWKSLAANLYEWRNVIQLAAIDCANENHTSICRDYNILAYPTVKFFEAHSTPSNLGTEFLKTQSEKDITRDVIGILRKEQIEGRGNHWPNIIPYRNHDVQSLWEDTNKHKYKYKFIFLIFVEDNDPLASEVILDFSNVKDITIRGVSPYNEVLSKFLGVRSYPSLLVLRKMGDEPEFLYPRENTRESFRSSIKSFLRAKGISVPKEPKIIKKFSDDEMPSRWELIEAREALIQLRKIKELGDVVFIADLENALRYSLEHEIPSRKVISGEAFKALNNYLNVLSKYFPMGKAGVIFVHKLKDMVKAGSEIRGMKFKTYLSNLSKGGIDSVLSTKEEWVGCRGSEMHFRGFPCGMWTLFHYLTVNALQNSNESDFDPLEVLKAMEGYITYFFGCTQCSQHFQQMVNRSMRSRVTNAEEAVLWLWSAHNEVNNRLAKDESEDPEFPKIQFPSSERCPDCKDANGHWDDNNVLKYLKSMYSRKNLNLLGSDVKLYNPNNYENDSRSKWDSFEDATEKKINRDFNLLDISLCVVLYVLSALICIGVCLKFILKRKLRKKSHSQDLLGRA